jgi:hypothetical protein
VAWAGFEESSKRRTTGYAVDSELVNTLELPQRGSGARSEMSVDRKDRTVPRKQELSDGNVPAQRTDAQDPTAEPMPAQLTQSRSRRGTNSSVNGQSISPLKAP